MTIESRIQAFVQLGSLLNKHTVLRGEMDSEFELAINRASVYNGWFTQKNIVAVKWQSFVRSFLCDGTLKFVVYAVP